MRQEIIDKFGLKPTDIQIGQTFMYNVIVYQYKEDFFVAKCDKHGKPTENNTILFLKQGMKRDLFITEEFLLDMPVEHLDKIIIDPKLYQ